MKTTYTLKIAGIDYEKLRNHLFPGDGKEAAAIALCGRNQFGNDTQLLIHQLILIPYEECSVRRSNLVKWPTDRLKPLMEKAEQNNMSILKIHCHPTWYEKFSETDNISDKELFSSVYGWVNDNGPHASAVMLPDGSLFARVIVSDLTFVPISKIIIAGDDIKIWQTNPKESLTEFDSRNAQAFGPKTTSLLNKLKIGVVGCSGTGSMVIEQLHRLRVGELVLIDPEVVENVNLNRIPYTTINDATLKRNKVDVFKDVINSVGMGTKVTTFNKNLYDDEQAIKCLASCDVIFGCMDSVDGRHLLNRIATFYLTPYIDLGVKIIADGNGGIEKIIGVVHYLQPGCSTLMSRGVYNAEELRSANIKRTNPGYFREQLELKYIANVDVPSPAVISINMAIASMAVNDFLSRIHPFRYSSNTCFAKSIFDISDWTIHTEKENGIDKLLAKYVGRGDMKRLLDMDLK